MAQKNLVRMGRIPTVGAGTRTSGLALTTATNSTLEPTARSCAEYVKFSMQPNRLVMIKQGLRNKFTKEVLINLS